MERVYYRHRLGEKPPFEQALPPATLENLIRQDLRREAVLKKVYDRVRGNGGVRWVAFLQACRAVVT